MAERFNVAADVWSVTSYPLLRRGALAVERWNRLHPGEPRRTPEITVLLADEPWPVVAVSDGMKAIPDMIARWVPGGMTPLGTDGFGRSDARNELREFFEVNAAHITIAALGRLADVGKFDANRVAAAVKDLKVDPEKIDPATA